MNNGFNFSSFDDSSKYRSNVMDEEAFKNKILFVFEKMANWLSNTYGPFGTESTLEIDRNLLKTKDGWRVAKYIKFNEMSLDVARALLIDICQQVVLHVGDGSTSAILAAYTLFSSIEESNILEGIRSKDFIDTFKKVVDEIVENVLASSTKIDESNLDMINRIALISTNFDIKIADMITDIYRESGSSNITYLKGNKNETYSEIVNGYEIKIAYLDASYATTDTGACEINSPILLMFDHTLEFQYHAAIIDKFVEEMQMKYNNQKRVVVIAPNYDSRILTHIRKRANACLQNGYLTPVVFCTVSTPSTNFVIQYTDFISFTGGKLVSVDDLFDYDDEKGKIVIENFDLNEFVGGIAQANIGKSQSLFTGFFMMNELAHDQCVRDAKAKYSEMLKVVSDGSNQFSELYELKKRVDKLSGKMSYIYAGGMTPMEKQAAYDSIEDAVKACLASIQYGYNIGGCLTIPIIINRMIKAKEEKGDIEVLEKDILLVIRNAFAQVFKFVFRNKYKKELKNPEFRDGTINEINEIINNCVYNETCYDVMTEQYSNDVINPANTDTEILKATSTIIVSLLSSNQLLTSIVDYKIPKRDSSDFVDFKVNLID